MVFTHRKMLDDVIDIASTHLREPANDWVTFTRAEAEAILAALYVIKYDCTGLPSVEAKAIEWANRISGPKGKPHYHPDPIGVLEMCADIMSAGLSDVGLKRTKARAMCRSCGGQDLGCSRCEGSGYDPED